jgi:hypothetical protein
MVFACLAVAVVYRMAKEERNRRVRRPRNIRDFISPNKVVGSARLALFFISE